MLEGTRLRLLCGFLCVCFIVSGCSNQQLYSAGQSNERSKCVDEPYSTYDECIARTEKSYQEYKQERDMLLEDEES
ncbi:hypothetical protein [Agaribacterium sp. ZY112]|uniref:hypothetical protein n=1 Tax=Agaribacterium sp. ZY112 TaxID=3233574 RepID=UPI00352546C5